MTFPEKKSEKALVLGGRGLLGQSLVKSLEKRGWVVFTLDRGNCKDPTDSALLRPVVEKITPDVIFNTIAWTQVNDAEIHPDDALAVNRDLPALLAEIVKGTPIYLIHYSTDYVFNGRKGKAYIEEDKTDPLNVYGSSKLAGEQVLLANKLPNICVVRSAWLFGPGRKNFVMTILEQAKRGKDLTVVHDQIGSPTYTLDLAEASVNLAERRISGLFHVVNSGQASWYELASEAVRLVHLSTKVKPIATTDRPQPIKRPHYTVLNTEKYASIIGQPLRPWTKALQEYILNFLSDC